MHKLLKLVIACVVLAVPMILHAQGQARAIGGNATQEEIAEFMSQLPADELRALNARMSSLRRGVPQRDSRNDLSADQLDTLALQRVYRKLNDSNDSEVTAFSDSLSSAEKAEITTELASAFEFAQSRVATSRAALCDQWNRSRRSAPSPVEASLAAYREQETRVEPEINDRYQLALARVDKLLAPQKREFFYSTLLQIRGRYENANATSFAEAILNSQNGAARIRSMCE